MLTLDLRCAQEENPSRTQVKAFLEIQQSTWLRLPPSSTHAIAHSGLTTNTRVTFLAAHLTPDEFSEFLRSRRIYKNFALLINFILPYDRRLPEEEVPPTTAVIYCTFGHQPGKHLRCQPLHCASVDSTRTYSGPGVAQRRTDTSRRLRVKLRDSDDKTRSRSA